MKSAFREALLAISLIYLFCSGVHSLFHENTDYEAIYQELSESRDKTEEEEKYLENFSLPDAHPLEFIEPLHKPEPVQEEFEWPLCWEVQCGDA